MKKSKSKKIVVYDEPQRHLSPWRVLFAMFIIAGLSFSSLFGLRWWTEVKSAQAYKSWYAPYVDVTTTPLYAFEQLGTTPTKNVVLSFIVSSIDDACTPAWGSVYSISDAKAKLDLDRRIARLEQQDGEVAVSFGGQKNDELAVKCADQDKLIDAYRSVIDHYNLSTIDIDLENQGLTDRRAAERRADALAKLQMERRNKGKPLAIWVTLPVAPQGLTEDGTNAISILLSRKVDIAGLNVMTMDYGQSRTKNESMAQASAKALNETHRQLGILYKKAGINLQSATLWKKMGATPMIGQNDIANDIFALSDAVELNTFAKAKGLGRISMWSVNRDAQCGDNYVDTKIVSTSCSGTKQDKLSFSVTLSKAFDGKLSKSAGAITKADDTSSLIPDDPAKSPYQIWSEKGAYLAGTKVVWHHNVYKSKWWTQGEMPDNPVLQSWQTAWQLIGPVLPNEKPVVQPKLPEGIYPDWTGDGEYEAGDRILFNGIPFQAKWWNKGESPAASAANADSSPWLPLSLAEVEQIIQASSSALSK